MSARTEFDLTQNIAMLCELLADFHQRGALQSAIYQRDAAVHIVWLHEELKYVSLPSPKRHDDILIMISPMIIAYLAGLKTSGEHNIQLRSAGSSVWLASTGTLGLKRTASCYTTI